MKLQIIGQRIDPRTLGADCDNCPLSGYQPVFPAINTQTTHVLCGEAPGREEVIQGRPFVGASGWFLDKQLVGLGAQRSSMHVTNALLCRAPKKFNDSQWKKALRACKPRLDRELATTKATNILAMGGKANWILTDPAGPFNEPAARDKIISWIGAPLGVGGISVMPSLHPAYVLRVPHFKEVFKLGLRRFLKPPAPWVWPRTIIRAGEEMQAALKEILASGDAVGTDIENTGDPLKSTSRIRCIGVATKDVAVSVPVELNPTNEIALLRLILAGNSTKVMHNGQHDLLGLKRAEYDVGGILFDTLLAHAVVAPILPHDLGFVASLYFHAPRWKAAFKVESEDRGLDLFVSKPIEDLCLYNARDAYMQRILMNPLEASLG